MTVPRNAPTTPTAAAATDVAGTSIADPGPLGLAAFAMTTFVLSCFNAGLINEKLEPVVLGLALFYGGIGQFAAGMWEFRKGNTFGALAFSSYGAFWLSFFFYVRYVAADLPAADAHTATGLYLLGWTIFTAYMVIPSLRTTGAIAMVFIFLALTFLFLAIGNLGDKTGIIKLGGYLGLITAILAWYGSFASVTNATFKKVVVPVFPLG